MHIKTKLNLVSYLSLSVYLLIVTVIDMCDSTSEVKILEMQTVSVEIKF